MSVCGPLQRQLVRAVGWLLAMLLYFMIVAILLTLIHEGKPHFGKLGGENGVPHSRRRSASDNENPSLGDYAIPITTTGPDFQRHPHFPPSFHLLFPFPVLLALFNSCSSVVLLAADWSGVSLRWSLTLVPPLLT